MSDTAESVFSRVMEVAQAEMGHIVDEATDDLKQRCSVSVGYAGHRIIRSSPGEPPRKETGGYVASIEGSVDIKETEVDGSVGSDLPLSDWLNNGTSRMAPRPHNQLTEDKFGPTIEERIATAINAAP